MPRYPPEVPASTFRAKTWEKFRIASGAWRALVPLTPAARLKAIARPAKFYLFALSLIALAATHMHQRSKRALEGDHVADRVPRRGYVVLPDGRLAQVWPQVDVRLDIRSLWQGLGETLNPVP
eukprot:NODE_6789_length_606_cov_6.102334_g5804_i0.p1 GENE.NODE_6789_length_606_cov_6.102334_g5804_i0~~NODE_6789_length_606_cov_6.102334_g5804_i0.p1  ORF type:complete len:123 (+),score=2.73 NODE_6789_length_606_cov_6.102334_g5804_i0:157-525(+)